jgi:hypothetical protein
VHRGRWGTVTASACHKVHPWGASGGLPPSEKQRCHYQQLSLHQGKPPTHREKGRGGGGGPPPSQEGPLLTRAQPEERNSETSSECCSRPSRCGCGCTGRITTAGLDQHGYTQKAQHKPATNTPQQRHHNERGFTPLPALPPCHAGQQVHKRENQSPHRDHFDGWSAVAPFAHACILGEGYRRILRRDWGAPKV